MPANLVLDFTRTETLDAAILGTLLNLPKRAEYVKREVRIVGAKERVLRALKAVCADEALTLLRHPGRSARTRRPTKRI